MFKGNRSKSHTEQRASVTNNLLEAWYYASRAEEAEQRRRLRLKEAEENQRIVEEHREKDRVLQCRMTCRALIENGFHMAAVSEGMSVPYSFVYYSWVRWRPPREAMTYDLFCLWPRKPEAI